MTSATNDTVIEKLVKANTQQMVELGQHIHNLHRQIDNLAEMVADLRREISHR